MASATENTAVKAKCIVQQCLNAKLFTKLKTNESDETEFVEVSYANFYEIFDSILNLLLGVL
jgi:hypothetical protein